MNDEIKEMLDKLKDGNWYNELDLTGTMWIELRWEETHLLLDYITNLQQDYDNEAEENLKLSEWLVEKQQRIEGLETENERLKEENVYCNRTDCVGRIKDSRKYDSVYQEKEDYKSRCEKGIETIDNMISNGWILEQVGTVMGYSPAKKCCKVRLERIKNILQNGSDSH